MACCPEETERDAYRRRWSRELMGTHLNGLEVATALVTHKVLSTDELDKLRKMGISRVNDALLQLVSERVRVGRTEAWQKFSQCVADLQPPMAHVPNGDFLDLLCFAMKQFHLSWLATGKYDLDPRRGVELDDFVSPRIHVFCRQSFLRDVSINEILEKAKNTIEYNQLFDRGDDLLDPNGTIDKVLLRGKQGFGKTTLASHITQMYGAGELWPDKILLMFFCRDLNFSDKILSFRELVEQHHGPPLPPHLWDYIWEDLTHRQDKIICVLDSLGSFKGFSKHNLMDCQRFIDPYTRSSITDVMYNVLNSSLLRNMKVLATSRGDCLRENFMFHRVAEIGVFKDQQKEQFANKFARGDTILEDSVLKTLQDKSFSLLCGQPTVCRFFAKHLKRVGDVRGHPQLEDTSWTKIMIKLVHHIIRYHHPQVKAKAPDSISSMLSAVKDDIANTANLALYWLCNFPKRRYLTEDELFGRQNDIDEEVISNGFLSILSTRDFKKVVHYWFIDQLIHQFFAAVGMIPNLNIQAVEDYVDREELRQSLLFLAGLLSLQEGKSFVKDILPDTKDDDALMYKMKLIQVTELLCTKLKPYNDESKLYLLHLAHESQLPDIMNIVSKAITDEDNQIHLTVKEPRSMIDQAAIQYAESELMKGSQPNSLISEPVDQLPMRTNEPMHEADQPEDDDSPAGAEGLVPVCQPLLEGLFTSILYYMHEMDTELTPEHDDLSITTLKATDLSQEVLNGKAKLLAEIFSKQSMEVKQHINNLHGFLLQRFHEGRQNQYSNGVVPGAMARDAKEAGILLLEPVFRCLHGTPNKEWFITTVPCYHVS